MILVFENGDCFRGFQDQFLGGLTQSGDDLFQGARVGDGLFHFFGLFGGGVVEEVSGGVLHVA